MNTVEPSSRTSYGTFEQISPLNLLAQVSKEQMSGCLKASSGRAAWSIYLEKGKLTFASLSIAPFDRLERHLRSLGYAASKKVSSDRHKVPQLFGSNLNEPTDDPEHQAICWLLNQHYLQPEQAATLIEEFVQQEDLSIQTPDYQALCWLFGQQYLDPIASVTLIEELAKEVLESFLVIETGTYELHESNQLENLPKFCRLQLRSLVEQSLKRIKYWQSLGPQIWSPYQRPYFFNQGGNQPQLPQELQQKLAAVLKGHSFRHLAVLLNQDERKLAKSLSPHIESGAIFLREPPAPFNHLPKITTPTITQPTTAPEIPSGTIIPEIAEAPAIASPLANSQRTYTIACVDDSPSILNEISRFLDDDHFSVVTIGDPVKALIQIVRAKPDLILLDVGMPKMDGYELCRLLRNHSLFKTTPIVMVTGHTGIIDRAKAKIVGASDYLSKPFTQSGLLKVVFKHLS